MSHSVIVINSVSPTDPGIGATEPHFKVSVEFSPIDGSTPAQIGNEVARIQRRVNQIIDGTPD